MENIYNEGSIQVLEGLEAVRKRPSMYIGNVDVEGLHHLVYEIIDNSIDEAMAGYCDKIHVIIHTDNSVTVIDNGRGIPIGIHKTEKVPALEVVMTKLHAGGKFDNNSYKVSGGLHGVGVSVVNALSLFLEVEISTGSKIYYQSYEKGKKSCELKIVGETKKRGTKIRFVPDTTILNDNNFNYDIICRRIRELAFLNAGIQISIEDERFDKKDTFLYKGGIVEFVEYLNRRNVPLHKPIFIQGMKNDVQIEVAIQYNETFTEKMFSFANNINTIEGGFHLIGFKAALTRCINQYSSNENLIKNLKTKISGDDVREGMTSVISIRIKDPQFEGQTKTKLGNSDVKGLVESLVNEKLSEYFEENPAVARKIILKAVDASRARDAAKRARDLARTTGSVLDATLPGKLAECQVSDPDQREIFLVEGDSAGGSAKQGRDRKFQAILPLKGKILNVEKARFDKILRSEEIKNIITVLGTGVGSEEYDIEKIRYRKVIIMTDADVDGSHIRTLLLTFFYRQMRDIIDRGYLYIAQPPLFKVGKGKSEFYLKDEKQFNEYVIKRASESKRVKNNDKDEFLSEKDLFLFMGDLTEYFTSLNKLERNGLKTDFIELLIKQGVEDKTFLQDQEKMLNLFYILVEKGFNAQKPSWHQEREIFEIMVEPVVKKDLFSFDETMKEMHTYKIGRRLIFSAEYQKALLVGKKIFDLDYPPFSVFSKEKDDDPITIDDKRKLLKYLIEEGKKGIGIQRYKGLGEMNPNQLWETTMNPEKRNLLQVKIDDVVDTDEVFTILMGDEVEPRRDFIQNNALEVSMLDI
jgi:DNA gyrase subunit B